MEIRRRAFVTFRFFGASAWQRLQKTKLENIKMHWQGQYFQHVRLFAGSAKKRSGGQRWREKAVPEQRGKGTQKQFKKNTRK